MRLGMIVPVATAAVAFAGLLVGAVYASGNLPSLNGDVDCSGSVTPVDSLKILRFDAGLNNSQEPGCAPIGDSGSGTPPTPTPTPLPAVGLSRDNPAPAGQPYLVPEGWELTILDFTPDATQEVLDQNQFNDPPAPGKQFSIVRVRVKNISAGNPEAHNVGFALRMVGSENIGYSTFQASCGDIPDHFLFKPDNLFQGGSVDGNVCYETAVDETDFTTFTSYTSDDENIRWFAVE